MGLTIDEIIRGLMISEVVDIMRKYQKIEEIVKAWNDNNSFDSMIQISEVIEDGNSRQQSDRNS